MNYKSTIALSGTQCSENCQTLNSLLKLLVQIAECEDLKKLNVLSILFSSKLMKIAICVYQRRNIFSSSQRIVAHLKTPGLILVYYLVVKKLIMYFWKTRGWKKVSCIYSVLGKTSVQKFHKIYIKVGEGYLGREKLAFIAYIKSVYVYMNKYQTKTYTWYSPGVYSKSCIKI